MATSSVPLQLLRDEQTFPFEDIIAQSLGEKLYDLYQLLLLNLKSAGLNLEWRYYKDGKAWLGKVTHNKKTVFWLSLWEGYIKAGFYFTEKHRSGVEDLDVSAEIKSAFGQTGNIGKLIPWIIDIDQEESLSALKKIIGFKVQALK
ncbi:MAG: DUF3788 family protein [Cyclobacteriaceae bacterium]|nr:DUF3788 family protein [Cyclobacteriaceae bacterium]